MSNEKVYGILRGAGDQMLSRVCQGATPKQLSDWLEQPLKNAAAAGDLELATSLLVAGATGSALNEAMRGGHERIVRDLLGHGASSTCEDERGDAPIHVACSLGFEKVVRDLLRAGASPTEGNRKDDSPIHIAIRAGHDRIVSELLQRGARVTQTNHGDAAIHTAARQSNEQIIHVLLREGADKDSRSALGKTPLGIAAEHGVLAAVKALLAAGANPNIREKISNGCDFYAQDKRHSDEALADNRTALDLAAFHGHVDVVKVMIQHGVQMNAADPDGRTALHHAVSGRSSSAIDVLLEAGADVEAEDGRYGTPLQLACSTPHASNAAAALLKHGADKNKPDCEGRTPLMLAIECAHTCPAKDASSHSKTDETRFGAARALLAAGADTFGPGESSALNVAARYKNVEFLAALIKLGANVRAASLTGRTALHEATACEVGGEACVEDVVDMLVAAGADVDAQDSYGDTPLHVACERGDYRAIPALLRQGSDVGKLDKKGRSPLYMAVNCPSKTDHLSPIKALLSAGADPIGPGGKYSAFHLAASNANDLEVVKLMIQHGASVCAAGADVYNPSHGEFTTALHLAAKCNSPKTINALVEAGADVDSQDNQHGWTPLHVACGNVAYRGGKEAVVCLLKHGADKNIVDRDGRTPLLLAMGGDTILKEATALVVAGADLDVISEGPWPFSAVVSAILNCRDVDLWKALIQRGVDVNTSVGGVRALHRAADRNDLDVIDVLIEAGADIESRIADTERTPLHQACRHFSPRAVICLLKHGANVNAVDSSGNTPLHLVADFHDPDERGTVWMVDLLLRRGADETVENEDGKAPFQMISKYRSRVHQILVDAPFDRAWRRRGVLVLCRCRFSPGRSRLRQEKQSRLPQGSSIGSSRQRKNNRVSLAKTAMTNRGGASVSNGGIEGRGAWNLGELGGLGGVLARLVELEEEGLFRKIVGLL